MSPDLQTVSWMVDRPEEQTIVNARRDGNSLVVSGQLAGRPFESETDLGDLPWYQTLSLSLLRHLPLIGTQPEFWIIRPDNMELQRMQVQNVREEISSHGGELVATWCIEIRPAGLLSAFWKGEYWFRKSDLRFLRYRGASSLPGAAMTEVSLLSESERP